MNEGMEPRLTRKEIERYIEDENTDIEALFTEVLDFLKNANVSKKVYRDLMERLAKMKEQQ